MKVAVDDPIGPPYKMYQALPRFSLPLRVQRSRNNCARKGRGVSLGTGLSRICYYTMREYVCAVLYSHMGHLYAYF